MQYFPLFVDTKELFVLIVGAGEVASRKLDLLARTDATIHVVAPEVAPDVEAYANKGRIKLSRREVSVEDMSCYDLIYLATANEKLNTELAVMASQKGIWVNVVDNPKFCRFITPSIVDRGRLVVAISTAGAAPVFARTIRSRLETLLPNSLAPLFDYVASKREDVQQKLTNGKDRRLFWERFFNLNQDRFDTATDTHYQQAFSSYASRGEILLLDETTPAGLLPIAVMPLLQKLDVVFIENDLDEHTNELLRRDASREPLPALSTISKQFELGDRMLLVASAEKVSQLKAHFPMAKHLRPGAI
ncbi:precorrin-2 dehydrogenase/sirohydrochlorin ferrochelatase family protein [Shewanella glacialimarina]|uniref:precorrin-2 dehydrogenase/sirohydrochlorin ferrochelatase family protein n=1 Tax=Shewanella glacialimarina TaxID=2590884 RepID=UPI001CF80966|nr:bifunctional precorrin-2 dehydrogenase/sirohydrochlorin ferrochelatase [Shewanella glacialimarina]UCX04024.1 bifunctional precorrin-2 dehydrogenase/sirohydrochlorin ferrochelatase [Shewanella glacialimarina]